jgi:N-acyl-L-homoserine lactone synthetase
MSNIDRSISNTDVIPVIESDLFTKSPEARDARFAIGVIAVGDEVTPGMEKEYEAYLRLRANVYADQTHMLDKSEVHADGTETDRDDARSVHFGIYEQHGQGVVRALSSIRLIAKTTENSEPLPIEDFFGIEAPVGTNEASRLISRHENPRLQEMNKMTLFAAAIAYINKHNLGNSYATVEPPVERNFKLSGMPVERVAEPVYVAKYKADNLGLVIDTKEFAERLEAKMPGRLEEFNANEGNMMYYGRMPKPALPPTELQPAQQDIIDMPAASIAA